MEPNAPSYVERAADVQLLDALIAGEYVYILDSRQKGKSSLVARTIVKLKEQGIATVKLDLQRIGANVTPEQWYAGLLAGIGQELGNGKELFEYWESRQSVGPLARWVGAISEVVLAQTQGQIVIFVDEVDFVRALDFSTDEFFAGIRGCYNRRSEGVGFERLAFCLVGVATPGQLIRNPEITPFNIGTKIELTDFSLAETEGYACALGNGRDGAMLIRRVHHWVNGHPYLTQLLCSHIATNPSVASAHDVDKLVKELFFTPEARHREPNFADVERRILDPDVPGMTPEERKTQVLELYGRLLRGKGVEASEENPVVASLTLAGVGNQLRGSLQVRNRVYKTVFDEGWRRQSLPHAELRRMQGATRLAILRTTAVAGVVLLALAIGAAQIYKLAKDRERALVTLGERGEELQRQSYVGLMADIRLSMSEDRWMRVGDLIRKSKENPLRGWEWGHAAISVNRQISDLALPKKPGGFERQPDGSLCLVTTEEIFRVDATGLELLRNREPLGIQPRFRSGDMRLGTDPDTQALVLQDSTTDRIVATTATKYRVFDFDPKTKAILVNQGGVNEDPFELLDLATGNSQAKFYGPSFAIALRLLSDGTILSVHQAGHIRRRDRNGKVLATAKAADVEMREWGNISLSFDGANFVFYDTRYRQLEIRRCSDLNVVSRLQGPLVSASTCSFSNDGSRLAVGNRDGIVKVFNVASGTLIDSFVGHRLGMNAVWFLEDNRHVLSVDTGANVKIWSLSAPKAIETHPTFDTQASEAFLLEKEQLLISTSAGWPGAQMLISRNLQTGAMARQTGWNCLLVLDSGLFVGHNTGNVMRLNPSTLRAEQTARVLTPTPKNTEPLVAIYGFSNGSRILVKSFDGPSIAFAILDSRSLKILTRFELNPPKASSFHDVVSFDEKGDTILVTAITRDTETDSIEIGGNIYLISGKDGRVLKEMKTSKPFSAAKLTADGKHLVLSTFEPEKFACTPTILETSTLKVVGTLPPTFSKVTNFEFDRTGQLLAGRGTGTPLAYLWDYLNRRKIATLAPGASIRSLAFSPDGERIITGATNRTNTIWNSRTGDEAFTLRYSPLRKDDQNGDAVSDTSTFSTDGKKVIMACTDGAIRIWNTIPWKDQPKAPRK